MKYWPDINADPLIGPKRPFGKRPTRSDRRVLHFLHDSSTAPLERCNEMEACAAIQAHSGNARRGQSAGPYAPNAGTLHTPRHGAIEALVRSRRREASPGRRDLLGPGLAGFETVERKTSQGSRPASRPSS